MDPALLPLRDVHLPPAPSWWPPAPGWWWLMAALAAALLAWAGWRAWRRARRRRWARWFDADTGQGEPAQRIAAMSALLRRAARRCRPGAELLDGPAWLRFLDGEAGSAFSEGPGRLLLEGGFRPRLDADDVEALRALARARFLALLEARR